MIELPRKAMVLSAGLGMRMRPLTEKTPKPLIEVGGKALIDWGLDTLQAAGVGDAVVNVHHLADQMEAHLANRSAPAITISDERAALLDSGGGLVKGAAEDRRGPLLYPERRYLLARRGRIEPEAPGESLGSSPNGHAPAVGCS